MAYLRKEYIEHVEEVTTCTLLRKEASFERLAEFANKFRLPLVVFEPNEDLPEGKPGQSHELVLPNAVQGNPFLSRYFEEGIKVSDGKILSGKEVNHACQVICQLFLH